MTNGKKSAPTPRLHHIVPCSFLALFATPSSKKGRLFVWDKKERRRWVATPQKACRERDFYKMEGADVDPATAENGLQLIENAALPTIRKILEDGLLPDRDEFDTVILFIALLEARGHGIRKMMERAVEDLGRIQLELLASNPDLWDSAVARAVNEGFDIKRVPDRGAFFDIVQSRRIRVKAGQNMKLNWIAYALSSLFPLLRQREWVLVRAPKVTRLRFITSDRPAVLAWSTAQPPSPYGIGYGFPETDVTVPIGPSSLLLGRFENRPAPVATDAYVATINSRTFGRAVKHVFTTEQDFAMWTRAGFWPGSAILQKGATNTTRHRNKHR